MSEPVRKTAGPLSSHAIMRDWFRTAYEGVELLDNFAGREEIESYRAHLLEKTRPQVEFILKNVDTPLRLLEIGTGNGRIPVMLAGRGVIEHALGLDISRSRIAFAREWAREKGFHGIEFVVGDILESPPLPGVFDLALCVTGTFGYFAAIEEGIDRKILDYIGSKIVDGGKLIVEIYYHPVYRRRCLDVPDRTYRYWDPLPPEDPFSHYLNELAYDEEVSILSLHKIFIRRKDGWIDDGRWEFLKVYREGEFEQLLERSGFGICSITDGFSPGSDLDSLYGTRVFVARREGGESCPS